MNDDIDKRIKRIDEQFYTASEGEKDGWLAWAVDELKAARESAERMKIVIDEFIADDTDIERRTKEACVKAVRKKLFHPMSGEILLEDALNAIRNCKVGEGKK